MEVQVTQAHIDNGRKRDCTACPAALALIEAGWNDVTVGPYSVTARPPMYRQGPGFAFTTTPNLRDFVDAVDDVGGRKAELARPGRILIGWPGMAGWPHPDARMGFEVAAES